MYLSEILLFRFFAMLSLYGPAHIADYQTGKSKENRRFGKHVSVDRSAIQSVIKDLSNVLIPHSAAISDHNKSPSIQNNGKICLYCEAENLKFFDEKC